MNQTSVFIVGGGPVGLAMGLLLHRFQIPCVIVERSMGTTNHPKSRGCFVRSMELFRQWGVEEPIRNRGLPPHADVWVCAKTFAGEELGRTTPEPNLGQSPSWKSMVSQDVVEEEILRKLEGSPYATVLYGTEALDFQESSDDVTIRARTIETGEEKQWRATYLIAADGAASQTRRDAGLSMVGPACIAVMSNDYWHGDMSHVPRARDIAGCRVLVDEPDIPASTILNTNGRDRWLSVTQIGGPNDERRELPDEGSTIERIRKQTGIPGLPIKMISRSAWRVSRQVAEKFRKDRVFLVGDAAHRFPPTGGYGLNSGVQDAHNLAWKLAFVLRGQASTRLLESYDLERRPIAQSNADFSMGNRTRIETMEKALRSGDRDWIAFWMEDYDNHLHSIGQSLGFRYEEGALLPDGTARTPVQPRIYTPSDRPGGRFPHIWLDPARQHSTLDWFDTEMTLVTGPAGQEWFEAGRCLARSGNVPLRLRQLPHDGRDSGIHMGPRGAVLVRPDGHVAWRIPYLPADPVQQLQDAMQGMFA
ncbi:MAG: hypothetical protein GY844_20750 [Bradyrhizobium sp.]|nr:hypothetical protein [Bradyrhizobium sp.]